MAARQRPSRPADGPRRTPPGGAARPPRPGTSPGTGTPSRPGAAAGSGPPPRTGPPPPPTSRLAQRVVAVLLTVLLFGLIVFGAGAGFATFTDRWVGYAVGGLFCVVMVGAGIWSSRR
ncbi:conserved hypothetical protein [Frankia canadensis]|uniref:Uncharacterized protein n=1 Tax=Frankia canadensis TaxID=1836972 RepID=A0A2I2L0S3_9ACTN|nr:hypothetical protein [Frankia canadensis]SNQ51516.1 conserved hypothetical protein [Frankia canadensis]SOU58806.1 conserved hypothetical protein [Frankia canadensis]